jgi:hypothetical protein
MMTRTGKLRIELPNPDGRLRANMFAEVEIMLGGAPVVQVPEGAVIDTGDRQVVILDLGEGRFRPEPVTVGRKGGGMIEIVSGVAAGDMVVSSATFLIDAESNLNAALAALAAPGHPGGQPMIARIIEWSARNVLLVLFATVFTVAAGLWSLRTCRSTPSPTCRMCR